MSIHYHLIIQVPLLDHYISHERTTSYTNRQSSSHPSCSTREIARSCPPRPSFFSSHLLLLTNSLPELQSTIRGLKSKYGPLVTLSIVSHPSVFIGSHSLAHQVLIPKGNTSTDRPKFFPLHGISTASYGPNWRAFRHNLASGFLSGSHVKSYSWARKWALQRLIGQLQVQQEGVGTIKVIDHIHLAMFRLSVLMCFGEKLDDHRVNDIASVNGGLLSLVDSMMFNVIFVSPLLAKILHRNKWEKLDKLMLPRILITNNE
ncbi:putative cytochrome P450 [Helianthus annuus]|nr:putative cytochrome P450 [Helianthus annuus]